MEPIRHILSLEPGTYLIKIHDNRKAGIMPLTASDLKNIIIDMGDSE